jgi:Icc-related predicted phosphoesterase
MERSKLFFVTDIHGSDVCFRKFVNAGKFYDVDILILGGDITGKLIVPIIERSDGTYECAFLGKQVELKTRAEVEAQVKTIRDSGAYPYETNTEGFEKLSADPKMVKELFVNVTKEGLTRWLAMAEERLKGTGIQCYISPGNDDSFEIDDVINSSSYVVNPEEKVVEIGGGHEMMTLGFTNHTPWNSPREVDEDALDQKIEGMASQIKDMRKAVFNLHVPPINMIIDQAPKLDKDLKPVITAGHMEMISAGSTAVRKAIEKHQPLIGLHGHIHESRGLAKIGRTLCLNPGSEYNSGILRGALCELVEDKVKSRILISG